MAFARPAQFVSRRNEPAPPAPAFNQSLQAAPPPAGPKMAPLKELKKLRKEFEEKIEKTLALKGDMSAVYEQVRSLGQAFDTLSQIMVDEMDSICSEVSRNKNDTAEQLSTLAKAMQSFTPEIAGVRANTEKCRSSAEIANTSGQKLKRWTEAGFKRLSEAMTVQQQALTVLDTQVTSITKRQEEARTDSATVRQECAEITNQQNLLRNHVTEMVSSHERVMKECQEQLRQTQSTVGNYELALSDRETWAGLQSQDLSRLETQLHEFRAGVETRLAALEKSTRASSSLALSKSTSAAERRISELEAELVQARRQLGEQDSRIRELQLQVQSCSERCLFSSAADRQQLSEAVSRAVQDYVRRNPPPRPDPEPHRDSAHWRGGSSAANAPSVHGSVHSSVHSRHEPSPQRFATPARREFAGSSGSLGGGAGPLESSALGPGRPQPGTLERVMEESQRRLESMRAESEARHSALSRAVEEIDLRIRQTSDE